MSVTEKLLFFNKEGYPYNFTNTNNIWNGKILFDPNGTDTFKNLSMYILEKVEPISITGNIEIVNDELYNINGLTITPYSNFNFTVERITPVNKDSRFYSKWIYGNEIDKKFPLSSIITFSGTIDDSNLDSPVGKTDFTSDKIYSVVSTKKNAIMIITDTVNTEFNLSNDLGTQVIYADFSNLKINSLNVISYPEFGDDLQSQYNPLNNSKISVVGTNTNDGVYELKDKIHTNISIYDFNLSGLTTNETFEIDVELLTERPVLYYGGINIYNDTVNNRLLANFLNKRSVSLNVGTSFILEDNSGNSLYNSNIYTIKSYIDTIDLGTSDIFITSKTETDDDGKIHNYTEIIYNPSVINLNEQDDVYLEYIPGVVTDLSSFYDYGIESINVLSYTSGNTIMFDTLRTFETGQLINIVSDETLENNSIFKIVSGGKSKTFNVEYLSGNYTDFNGNDIITAVNTTKNNNIKFKVLNIQPATVIKNNITVSVIINGITYQKALIDTILVQNGLFKYKFTKVLKEHEKNIVVVESSSGNNDTGETTTPIRCLSTSNLLKLTHSYINSFDQDNVINTDNSINETITTFINKYKSYLSYNGIDLYKMNNSIILESLYSGQKYYFKSYLIKNNTVIYSDKTYSDDNDNSTVYNLLLKEGNLVYERTNMSNITSNNFNVNIIFTLSDDVKDYGFNINIDGIDYYIPYNDTNTGFNTSYTIIDFVNKWKTSFNNIGLNLYQNNDYNGDDINVQYSSDGSINVLTISGIEPNVSVSDIKVRVNKFSTYVIKDLTYNNYMMVSSNYLQTSNYNFINNEFTTGMIISLYGSQYKSNNKEFNIIGISENIIELSYQGPMYSDNNSEITLISREYLRRPRETNIKDIYYNFRWEDDLSSQIFMYDLSGENLIPWNNHPDYAYTGVLPLPLEGDLVFLNSEPNNDKTYINTPHKQQTIFNSLKFKLERFDDDNATILPKPINVSFGYNSTIEGVHYRKLIMERVDNVVFSGLSDGTSLYFNISDNKITIVDTNNKINLLDLGFEVGREIRFKLEDDNQYTTSIFEDWQDFIITDVTTKTISVNSSMTTFSTNGLSFNYKFEQLPETIGTFTLFGETEGEDERLKSHMKMFGINLSENDEYIFAESNIKEQGVDYQLLNRKRKEMMSVYPSIYNYIGSYTSLFNAINFFGYTDLELYEYYRNVDINSPLFNSLKRVIVQDLFDKDVEGWSYSEDLSKKIGYKKTNLLNLTYKITDEEGNNTNLYSLSDVQIKLNGLKDWLRKWIIPINSNIRDITGVSQNTNTIWRQFDPSNNVFKHKTIVSSETINFNYIASKNFNDSWLVSVRFYNVNDFTPEYFDLKIITYSKDSNNILIPQSYHNIYKTDMLPFNFYMNWGDNISDKYMFVETTYYNTNGVGKKINKMYGLEDGVTYVYDEFKNYVLINNNFEYKYQSYVQDATNIYINDDEGNIYVITK